MELLPRGTYCVRPADAYRWPLSIGRLRRHPGSNEQHRHCADRYRLRQFESNGRRRRCSGDASDCAAGAGLQRDERRSVRIIDAGTSGVESMLEAAVGSRALIYIDSSYQRNSEAATPVHHCRAPAAISWRTPVSQRRQPARLSLGSRAASGSRTLQGCVSRRCDRLSDRGGDR